MKSTLVVIVGPTAVGKTSVAIELAKHFQTEIVSADSRQIYKEIPIGTAQPSPEERLTVPHHMIACRSINDYYNASMFEEEVITLLGSKFKTNPLIVMTGGSGLYIDAVLKGIDDLPTIDPAIRLDLKHTFDSNGLEWLQEEVKQYDPEYYHSVDIQNPKRLLKALEVYRMTGKPYSGYLTTPAKQRGFSPLMIGLNMDRKKLYQRINQRVDVMMDDGLEQEARSLIPLKTLNALNTVGYRELFDYFDGKLSREEAVERIKANTRKYARRQLTWFRREGLTRWFHPDELDLILTYVNNHVRENSTNGE